MTHIAATLPETRFRILKKRGQAIGQVRVAHRTTTSVAPTAAAQPMAVRAEKTAKAKKVQRTRGEIIASWWPVALGIFSAGFALDWHAMAMDAGLWAVRIAFPFSLLATHCEIGIDSHLAAMLPQAGLYLQFPLEGLLVKLMLGWGKSLKAAVMMLMLLHAVATLALWLLSFRLK